MRVIPAISKTRALLALLSLAALGAVEYFHLPYRSSWFRQASADSAYSTPGGDEHTVGGLRWSYRAYREAPTLEPFRQFFREHCASTRGFEAAVCVANELAAASPLGPVDHEFVDAVFDPSGCLENHTLGQGASHCVCRSGLLATTLLSVGIPARVVQLHSVRSSSGHNAVEIWSESDRQWRLYDPSFSMAFKVEEHLVNAHDLTRAQSPEHASLGRIPGGTTERAPDADSHFFEGAVLLPDPWLYTRLGTNEAPWPFRGAFAIVGRPHWRTGLGQTTLRGLMGLTLLVALLWVTRRRNEHHPHKKETKDLDHERDLSALERADEQT